MILLLDILDLGQVPYFSQLQFPHLEKVKWDGPRALWGSPISRSVTNSLGPSCDGWSFGLASKGFPKLQGAAYSKARGALDRSRAVHLRSSSHQKFQESNYFLFYLLLCPSIHHSIWPRVHKYLLNKYRQIST